MKARDTISKAGVVVGLGMVAIAAFIAWDTAGMQVPPTYAKVGPQAFPYLAAAALAVLGLFFIAQSFGNRPAQLRADTAETDWRALGAISVGLLVQPLLFEQAGFIISAALLFVLVARGFGSRNLLRDSGIGAGLAATVYFSFTRLLNLPLPAGIFKGWF